MTVNINYFYYKTFIKPLANFEKSVIVYHILDYIVIKTT